MFGFLQPHRGDVTYRRLYAGCCAYQHRRFGVETLPMLSYEGVFLYALAVDCGSCDLPAHDLATCCRLRTRGRRLHAVDSRVAEFCVSFGVLLAAIKLEDDVRDDRSLLARFALWRLSSRLKRARSYFATLDPEFHERVTSAIGQHLELERRSSSPSLESYSEPTSAAFAYVFELFAKALHGSEVDASELHAIGDAVGRAIIAFDCAVDYRRDRRLGRYNPLGGTAECQSALVESQRALADLMWRVDALGEQSFLAAGVAADTFGRVGSYRNYVTKEEATRSGARMHPRQGDCDLPCDACPCDGCGPCDAGDAPDAGFCCVDCFGGCFPDCNTGRRNKTGGTRKRIRGRTRKDFVGEAGVTVGPLNPSGVVLIAGKHVPARCDMGWVDDHTEVTVVRHESFGVVVRPVDSESGKQ